MAGKVITPRQLAQQWLRLPNKFEVNVFNFETLVLSLIHIFMKKA